MFPVTFGFYLFKGRTDFFFHFIEECGTEGIAEKGIIKVMDITPKSVIRVATFRNEAMDVWIPFQIPAKGVENHNKTGSEVHGLILHEKQT